MKKERKELRETNQEIKRERVRGKQHTLNGCSNSKTWQLNCRDKYGDTNHKIVCVGRNKMERDRYMCK